MIQFNFRGHIAPVFTPFIDDEKKNINFKVIPQYAKYLLKKGIHGLLVNGTTGEGMSMNVQERKQVTEEWVKICKETKQTLMIQVGGASLPDVLELAQHAEHLKVDALLCLPELYFKPKNSDELIKYLSIVSNAAPNTPLLYYHIPQFTNVQINMVEFLKKANKINTFVGIKFTSCDLIEGAECINVCDGKYAVFLGADQIMAAAYTLGFDSSIATTFNIFPEYGETILKCFNHEEKNVQVAQKTQKLLTSCINNITKHGGWVPTMKAAMNLLTPINVGPVREPLDELMEIQKEELKHDFYNVKNKCII